MIKVYCVEDDVNIRELLEYTLKVSGFSASGFVNEQDFFAALERELPDIILLDIMLPGSDGMQILSTLKEQSKTSAIPVIILTAKSGRMDKIHGLDSGADDYITKPFDVLELVSRIHAVLRRAKVSLPAKSEELVFGDITINPESRTVTVKGESVVLTYKEFELLYTLASNNGIVMTREKLMNKIWDTDFEGETRTVDVHIRTLRQKLGSSGECITTVRNVGYKIDY